MSRAATWLLSIGVLLFIGVLASQGLSAVMATLALAGWGLLLVALFHLLPLALDAWALRVLFGGIAPPGQLRDALLARWVGESANSLMPAGQLGGPVLMTRHLAHRGIPMPDAAAAVTVSTTLQSFAQIAFALTGVALLGAHATGIAEHTLRTSALIASALLALQVGGFYLLQRRGLFGKLMRTANRFAGKRDWSGLMNQAEAIDRSVHLIYGRAGPVAVSFVLSLVGWVVGTGEVYLILVLFHHPVSWVDALLLESLGQAIRGAAFAIPGALGVQEGGYLLLAPMAGVPPEAALALSLAKRTRELLLGLPGLLYLNLYSRTPTTP
ncbi:MAG: flippase-like domain-containing protein [Pseudomonadota bacterium]|nr:flippase-like domain-containing protein [Pseudomonadota bacterium]